MNRLLRLAAPGLFASSLASLPSCAGLDTGNAEVSTVQLALSAAPSPILDSSGATFGVTSARATVRHVDLYLPAGTTCTDVPGLVTDGGDYTVACDGDKIRARGPWTIDLLTGVATPALPTVPVVAGTYRRVDVRFDPGVDDLTLVIEGATTVTGASTPYRLALDFTDEVRFEGATFVASPDVVAQALLVLDPANWFAQLPLTQCAADGDLEREGGVLLIEDGKGACDKIEDQIVSAIGGSGRLEEDHDDD